jgi:hypothetical protein
MTRFKADTTETPQPIMPILQIQEAFAQASVCAGFYGAVAAFQNRYHGSSNS